MSLGDIENQYKYEEQITIVGNRILLVRFLENIMEITAAIITLIVLYIFIC